jgi:hypothetical protein
VERVAMYAMATLSPSANARCSRLSMARR